MSASEWVELIVDQAGLADLYPVPPSLDSCEVSYMHIDERDSSATLGFSTKAWPSRPSDEWLEKGHNTLEFYIKFTGVHDLLVDGWGPPGHKNIVVAHQPEGGIMVSIEEVGSVVKFLADAASVTHTHAYRAAAE
ncbi:Imm50 family immunity protein [Streptomyces massasporeus]|uniref:Imm50 family immunity protein n=1 Tax=Streptomyces massasporeus TaxID=67324 RepID=UPI0033EDBF2B